MKGKKGEWGDRKKWKGRKKERKKRDRNSGKGRATDDKFKWSQANEWGKTGLKQQQQMRKNLKKLMKESVK